MSLGFLRAYTRSDRKRQCDSVAITLYRPAFASRAVRVSSSACRQKGCVPRRAGAGRLPHGGVEIQMAHEAADAAYHARCRARACVVRAAAPRGSRSDRARGSRRVRAQRDGRGRALRSGSGMGISAGEERAFYSALRNDAVLVANSEAARSALGEHFGPRKILVEYPASRSM